MLGGRNEIYTFSYFVSYYRFYRWNVVFSIYWRTFMNITHNGHVLNIYENLFNYIKTVNNVNSIEFYKNVCDITGWKRTQADMFIRKYTAGRYSFGNQIALLKFKNKKYSYNPSLDWTEEDLTIDSRKGENKKTKKNEFSRMVRKESLLGIPEHWKATDKDIENVFKLAYARLGYRNIKKLPKSAPDLTYSEAMKEIGINDSVGSN